MRQDSGTDRSLRLLLVGRAGSGKDETARYLVERYGFRRYAFADKLKEIVRDLWPEAFKEAKPRTLLQAVGQCLRQVDPDVWVNYLLRCIEAERPLRAVVTDCRYRNELELCNEKGFLPVVVVCPDEVRNARLAARGDRPLSAEEAAHPSENEAYETAVQWAKEGRAVVLDNSGPLEKLYGQLDGLLRRFAVKE